MSDRASHPPTPDARPEGQVKIAAPPVAQLTPRALITGALIGAVTGVSNLYVGLKVGWSMGVVITAAIVGWAAWQAGIRARLLRSNPTVLEAASMASTASAAGYSTGTTLASAMSAWLLVTGHHLPIGVLTVWIGAVSTLGLFVAMGLRERLLVVEQLPFPTGAAAAETIESLAAADPTTAARGRTLLRALGIGLLVKWLTGVMPIVVGALGWPAWLALPATFPSQSWAHALPVVSTVVTYGFSLELSVLLPAAGVLVGWRVGWSMLLGAVLCYGGLAPPLLRGGIVASPAYTDVVQWALWPGATLMTVAGLVAFVWPKPHSAAAADRLAQTTNHVDDRPRRFVRRGIAAAGLACIGVQALLFDIPWPLSVLSVVLAIGLAVVAARVTGEADVTPMGPLGKITQLGFGVLAPGSVLPNLMAAGVTAGAAASAADLLTDLKAGHLLGADPRRQFFAQALGVLVGVLVVVPVFRYVLVPDVSALGTAQWPAPAARIWASVATLVGQGLGALPRGALVAVLVATVVATALVAAERLRPSWRAWLPSPTGLGLAFVMPATNAISFFIGGLIAQRVVARRPASMATTVIPIASGLIAGESLMGIVEALLTTFV